MKLDTLNLYGDHRKATIGGFGCDIAAQRSDDLDNYAIEFIKDLRQKKNCVYAIDAGCGVGGQSIRMALAGAEVIAIDVTDYSSEIYTHAQVAGCESQISFIQSDIRSLKFSSNPEVDLIICQRTIHYLPWEEAVAALQVFRDLLKPQGLLFLSASGINSELGQSYEHGHLPANSRYCPLESTMSEKHSIYGKVCLYDEIDLGNLLFESGFDPSKIYASPFGNIKSISEKAIKYSSVTKRG